MTATLARPGRESVLSLLCVIGGAVPVLGRGGLELSLFEDLGDDVDVLVGSKVRVELLLARVSHDALCSLSSVKDLEGVDDVGQGNRLVASLPLVVGGAIGDYDLVEVSGVNVRLVDDLVE